MNPPFPAARSGGDVHHPAVPIHRPVIHVPQPLQTPADGGRHLEDPLVPRALRGGEHDGPVDGAIAQLHDTGRRKREETGKGDGDDHVCLQRLAKEDDVHHRPVVVRKEPDIAAGVVLDEDLRLDKPAVREAALDDERPRAGKGKACAPLGGKDEVDGAGLRIDVEGHA